jgi:hypothetical protein
MFGSTTKTPRPKQRPLGIDETHASTSEEARPLPWFSGRTRVGLTFITDVFRQKAVAVTQTVGKQKTKTGYNYYASFAGVACHGPVDGLHDIFLNGESVYASSVRLQCLSLTSAAGVATFTTRNAHGLVTGDGVIIEGANQGDYNGVATATVTGPTTFTYPVFGTPASPATGTITAKIQLPPVFREGDNLVFVDVLIPDYGTMRLYWGTQDQVPDPILIEQSGQNHPAYKGSCYARFDQLFLGFNQTNVQTIELVLSRKPTADWHALEQVGEDANPVAAALELIQHPAAGAGVLDEDLDTAGLISAGEDLADEGLGISPLVTRQQSAGEFLLQLLEYLDAFPTTDGSGRLSLTLCRPPAGDPLELTDADLAEFPKFQPADWRGGFTALDLRFTQAERGYKEDMVRDRQPFLKSIIGRPNYKTVDRLWVTDSEVAARMAAATGRAAAMPQKSGSAVVLKKGTLFADLAPGALLRFDILTRDLRWQTFRVEERTDPGPEAAEFEITFRVDYSNLYNP